MESGDTGLKAEQVRRRGGHSGWGAEQKGHMQRQVPTWDTVGRGSGTSPRWQPRREGKVRPLWQISGSRSVSTSRRALAQRHTLSLFSPLCFETWLTKIKPLSPHRFLTMSRLVKPLPDFGGPNTKMLITDGEMWLPLLWRPPKEVKGCGRPVCIGWLIGRE